MAGASDKARFYLEQVVPELKEYEKKGIFSKEEITHIARQRSTFEHTLNARGSHPTDYARYAEYEMNLDSLRRKRVKRLGVKCPAHSGQRRIYFVLDRAVRKFHGDVGLWMQYIEYARKQKAYKKLAQILTRALRLHPTKADLWIYAARYVLEEQADMTEARSYMQRGLRFCRGSRRLWVEYGRLECIYLAKIVRRRKILGLDGSSANDDTSASFDDPDADMIAVPAITGEDISPSLNKDDPMDQEALQNLYSTPALRGAIPIAIFDTAIKQFGNDESFSKDFYDMVEEFEDLPCLRKILSHVVEVHLHSPSASYPTHIRHVKCAVAGIPVVSADFPPAFGTALERLTSHLSLSGNSALLSHEAVLWIAPMLKEQELDDGIRKICISTIRKTVRNITQVEAGSGPRKDAIDKLASLLHAAGDHRDADTLSKVSSELR